MQKTFNNLTINKKRKFLVKNLLRDDYFMFAHSVIKFNCICELNFKNQCANLIESRNEYHLDKFSSLLTKYKDFIIDLYTEPNNKYYYNQVVKYKNKIKSYPIYLIYKYKDFNDFGWKDLFDDVVNITKSIVLDKNLSIENLFL